MWWALFWAFIIGSLATTGNVTDAWGGGALVAFFVIWYFVWKSEEMHKTAISYSYRINQLETEKRNRIDI
jgi:hypothetical protein